MHPIGCEPLHHKASWTRGVFADWRVSETAASGDPGPARAFSGDAPSIKMLSSSLPAAHRVIFNTIYKGSHVSFRLRSIRFVRDVAVAFAQVYVSFKKRTKRVK